MVYRSLRDFLKDLEDSGELVRFNEEVSLDLELAAILRELARRGGPVVIFERIKEGTLPAVGNIFGTWGRVVRAVGSLTDAASRMASLINVRPPSSLIDAIKSIGDLTRVAGYMPKRVSRAPVKEREWRDVDLGKIPALRQWPLEPGRFITFGATFIKHGGLVNFGYYRLQVLGKDRFIVHWMPWRRSEYYSRLGSTEIAVVLGPDPVTMLMAGVPIPHPLDKVFAAGVVRGEGVEVVEGSTVDLTYPANAELVIEAKLTGEYADEGPFGDHVGYYSIVKKYPVAKVTAVYSREDPLIPVTTTAKPVMEDGNIIRFGVEVLKPLLTLIAPEVKDIYMPPEGVGYVTVVSIEKRYPGEARRVMNLLWGLLPVYNKVVVVVDSDVDVRDLGQVLYSVAANVNPQRDIVIVPESPTEELDPSTPIPNLGSKVGIDATRKLPEEYGGLPYPQEARAPGEVEGRAKAIVDEILGKVRKAT